MKKKKHSYDFKVGDIVVDCAGQKGVVTEVWGGVQKDGFRGFNFTYEDTGTDGWIEEFADLKGIHRVGDYIFEDYDLESTYEFLKDIENHIANLEKEKAIVLKGIEYIKKDIGDNNG